MIRLAVILLLLALPLRAQGAPITVIGGLPSNSKFVSMIFVTNSKGAVLGCTITPGWNYYQNGRGFISSIWYPATATAQGYYVYYNTNAAGVKAFTPLLP